MVAEHNPIVNRINGHKSRIRGMLTPGLKRKSRDRQTGHLSSIFAGFGGARINLAAKKMRYLDVNKLGTFQPASRKKFNQSIPKKYRQTRDMIHFSPGYSRDVSIWSQIEKTLPSQSGFGFEASQQPSELRRGSVIQKFSMFPKPGQSIESFKDAARSLPKRKPPTVTSTKPSFDPQSRLFSRVQEIAGDEGITQSPEVPEETVSGDSPESVQRQIEPPDIPRIEDSTDFDQVDIGTLPVEKKKDEPVHLDEVRMPITHLPKAKPLIKKTSRTPDSRPLVKAKTKKKIAAASKPLLMKAKPPFPKPGIIQRLPDQTVSPIKTKSSTSTPQVKADPLLPDAGTMIVRRKPEQPIRPKELKPTHPIPVQSDLIPPETRDAVVRRKPEQRAPQKESKTAPPRLDQTQKGIEPGSKADVPLIPELESLQEVGQDTPIDLPLRKKIQSHKHITDAFKSLRPEKILPPISPPLLGRQSPPMIDVEKYISEAKKVDVSERSPEKQLTEFEDEIPQLGLRSIWHSDPESAPTSLQMEGETGLDLPSPRMDPLPMSLAYARSPRAVGQTLLQPAQPPAETSQPATRPGIEEKQPVQPTSILEPGEALVQRVTEDEFESDPAESIGSSLAEVGEDEPEDLGESVNLDQLAEDVLPLVKRILEIESERLSTNLQ